MFIYNTSVFSFILRRCSYGNDISAEKKTAEQSPWFSGKNEDSRRKKSSEKKKTERKKSSFSLKTAINCSLSVCSNAKI